MVTIDFATRGFYGSGCSLVHRSTTNHSAPSVESSSNENLTTPSTNLSPLAFAIFGQSAAPEAAEENLKVDILPHPD
jgi:hypothetical protein